jgi:hypothetical protein
LFLQICTHFPSTLFTWFVPRADDVKAIIEKSNGMEAFGRKLRVEMSSRVPDDRAQARVKPDRDVSSDRARNSTRGRGRGGRGGRGCFFFFLLLFLS